MRLKAEVAEATTIWTPTGRPRLFDCAISTTSICTTIRPRLVKPPLRRTFFSVTEPRPGRAITVLAATLALIALPAILRLAKVEPVGLAVIELAVAATFATALTVVAVISPFSRFSPVMVEVSWIVAVVAVFWVNTVLRVAVAFSTLPLSPACRSLIVLDSTSPLVPRHGQGW